MERELKGNLQKYEEIVKNKKNEETIKIKIVKEKNRGYICEFIHLFTKNMDLSHILLTLLLDLRYCKFAITMRNFLTDINRFFCLDCTKNCVLEKKIVF